MFEGRFLWSHRLYDRDRFCGRMKDVVAVAVAFEIDVAVCKDIDAVMMTTRMMFATTTLFEYWQ